MSNIAKNQPTLSHFLVKKLKWTRLQTTTATDITLKAPYIIARSEKFAPGKNLKIFSFVKAVADGKISFTYAHVYL